MAFVHTTPNHIVQSTCKITRYQMYKIFRIIIFRILNSFSPEMQYNTKIKKKETNHTFKVMAEVMGHVKGMDDGAWSLVFDPCQWIFYHAVSQN